MAQHQMRVDDGGGREGLRAVNLPNNSHAAKKTESAEQTENTGRPKVEKIVTGKVVKTKPSLLSRMLGDFNGETTSSVFEYVVVDVALPALKNMLWEMVSQVVERKLFGDTRKPAARSNYTNYGGYGSRQPGATTTARGPL